MKGKLGATFPFFKPRLSTWTTGTNPAELHFLPSESATKALDLHVCGGATTINEPTKSEQQELRLQRYRRNFDIFVHLQSGKNSFQLNKTNTLRLDDEREYAKKERDKARALLISES
ncbi:hypothetical protein QLX08_003192 [Tetragonisca angustula]|uniref:Uncharacterized protein n=1 Tax=Tetragonisca angustula TaxID=166442 RepID=A0AAW1A9X7_9HYME